MRRKAGNTAPAISLFPFLAVLLCTMGALVVVLVVLNRQSRLQAATLSVGEIQSRRADAEQLAEQNELRRGALVWQLEHLQTSRDKTQVDLDNERLRLSGVEEHRRQLEAQLAELERAAAELDRLQADDGSPADSTDDLAKLNRAIRSAHDQLAATRQQAASQAPAYSVIPYDGPNRTRRRPIYIECSGDRVTIQPEGIMLRASDFDGPLGPANPLASAVRAARDHIVASAGDRKSPDAEPYPLFLVRPDGIEAYYAARAAMLSWGSDFGYQTIDQDWELDFPPADPRLAQLERQAVDEARERLRWLAQLSPDRYGSRGKSRTSGNKVSYRVSPMGGLIREGGPSLSDSTGSSSPGGGRGFGTRDRFGSFSERESKPDGGTNLAEIDQQSSAGTSGIRGPELRSTGGAPSETLMKSQAGAATGSETSAGSNQNSSTLQDAEVHGQAANAAKRRYGDLNDRANRQTASRSDRPYDLQGSASTDPDTGQTGVEMKVEPKKEKPRSLAESRGVNWGLSPSARASNPITRPIHVVCQGDKLVLRSERSNDSPIVVPLRIRTEDSIDEFAAAIQERIKDWGIAGRGLYWRPQLVLEVGHSGEGRYADLEALMADSGFDVKRKQ
jgi:hypothetical protein